MSVNWEKQEGNQGLLTVTVAATEVDKALDQAFKKVVKHVAHLARLAITEEEAEKFADQHGETIRCNKIQSYSQKG